MKITMLASLLAPASAFVAPTYQSAFRHATRAFSRSIDLMANPKGRTGCVFRRIIIINYRISHTFQLSLMDS